MRDHRGLVGSDGSYPDVSTPGLVELHRWSAAHPSGPERESSRRGLVISGLVALGLMGTLGARAERELADHGWRPE